jgi:hypothetical protein
LGACLSGGLCHVGVCIESPQECLWDCGVEKELECGEAVRGNTLSGKSRLGDTSCLDGQLMGPEALFSWTSDIPQDVTFIFEGETGTEVLVISSESEGGCADESCVLLTGGTDTVSVSEGETLQLRVDSVFLSGGVFSLGIRCGSTDPLGTCEEVENGGCEACSCETCVCGEKPTCCTEEWTEVCSFLCDVSCGGCGVSDECSPALIPGIPETGACADCVCQEDSLCCSVAWDGLCVTLGQGECGESCGCSVPEGSCCQVHGGIGCNEPSCAECVCKQQPSCCNTLWDESCLDLTGHECVVDCPCADETMTCCAPHSQAGCEDTDCESCVCAAEPHCCEVSWDGTCVTQSQFGDCAGLCPCGSP